MLGGAVVLVKSYLWEFDDFEGQYNVETWELRES